MCARIETRTQQGSEEHEDGLRVRCPQCGDWFGAEDSLEALICGQCSDEQAKNEWMREHGDRR